MNNVLQLTKIRRVYPQAGGALEVLRGVDFNLNAGETVALVGPSGSGKSTLLQIAGLLDTPDSGEMHVMGEPMQKASDKKRTAIRNRAMGFVYQYHHLLPEFSARENVMMPLLIAGMAKEKAEQRAFALLDRLGLSGRVTHRPAELSGGEQQRVALARALANKPKLLLADEPTGNLDPATSDKVFALILEIVREEGLAALIATHNPDLARRMDRTVQLENGLLK